MTDFQYSPMQVEWLDRLASGETVQGKARLNFQDSMCCLGVACDMFAARIGMMVSNDDLGGKSYDGYRYYAPPKIVMALGLANGNGSQLTENTRLSLSEQNDTNMTHPEIAALIRSNPRAYLKEVQND